MAKTEYSSTAKNRTNSVSLVRKNLLGRMQTAYAKINLRTITSGKNIPGKYLEIKTAPSTIVSGRTAHACQDKRSSHISESRCSFIIQPKDSRLRTNKASYLSAEYHNSSRVSTRVLLNNRQKENYAVEEIYSNEPDSIYHTQSN